MSDQAIEQSPQSRLEAMLGDIQEEAVQEPIQEEPQEEEELVEDTTEDSENEEEVVEDTNDEEPETEDDVEEDSEEQTLETVKLKVNGEEIEKPLDEVVALAQQGLDYTKKTLNASEKVRKSLLKRYLIGVLRLPKQLSLPAKSMDLLMMN
jgi:microsomal dipeptidase-like Zn-dependent dipeptidase